MENFDEEDENKHTISQDEKYLLASGLFKMCRLGHAEEAVKFAEKLRRGTSDYYVMRILTQLCGEDVAPDEFVKLIPAVRALYEASKKKDLRGHCIWQMTFAIAKSRKWYQTSDGEELEIIRHKVNKKNKEIKTIEPDFLFDQHVREGIRRVKEGTADLRLSGKWEYRLQLLHRWQRLVFDFPDWDYNRQRERWIQIHLKPQGGTKNDRQTEINEREPQGAVDGAEQPDKSKDGGSPENQSQEKGNQKL